MLEWMEDFERKLQLRNMSRHLMYIAVAKDELVEHIMEYSDRDVDGTPSCKRDRCSCSPNLDLQSSPQYIVSRKYHFDKDHRTSHGILWESVPGS